MTGRAPIPLPAVRAVPPVLHARDQWVCWRLDTRNGTQTKVPIDPRTGRFASTTDASTWTSFEQAHAFASENGYGVGYVFTDADPFVGVDLDGCRDPETGTLDDWAQQVIETLDSYTELSPSGTGVHVIVRGELPPGRNRRGTVECYETARYFTVTGEHLDRTPRMVQERTRALATVYRAHLAEEADTARTHETAPTPPQETSTEAGERADISDEELLERAHSAENGATFAALWGGSTAGYDSASEADMALCCLLAFWTGSDAHRMDRLFRDSGLMREKWDIQHYADGRTYGEVTVRRAAAFVTDHYDPARRDRPHPTETADSREPTVPPEPSPPREYIRLIETLERALRELEAENEQLRTDLEHATAEPPASRRRWWDRLRGQ